MNQTFDIDEYYKNTACTQYMKKIGTIKMVAGEIRELSSLRNQGNKMQEIRKHV
jgi:hypothetical protein